MGDSRTTAAGQRGQRAEAGAKQRREASGGAMGQSTVSTMRCGLPRCVVARFVCSLQLYRQIIIITSSPIKSKGNNQAY